MHERTYALSTATHKESEAWSPEGPLTWAEVTDRLPSLRCWVGGTLSGPKRSKDTVVSRSILTLDEDEPARGWAVDVDLTLGCAFIRHTTKRHTPSMPRYRLLVPLSRDVTPDEYWLIANAVMDVVGWGKDRGGAQAERFMFGPPEGAEIVCVEGEPLDVDAWLSRAEAIEPRHGERAARDADPDGPASDRQINRAYALLDQAAWEVENLKEQATGQLLEGRNAACIKWLPTLYRFALGDCLDESEIDARIRQAAQAASGDHPFTDAEYSTVSQSAWGYATEPDRPDVEEASDVFTPMPIPEGLPSNPDLFFDPSGLRAKVLADTIANYVTYAVDSRDDRQFYVYRDGCWVPGGKVIPTVTAQLLGDRYRRAHLSNAVDMLRYTPGVREIDCGPTPRWINVPNGLLDWQTGELHPHTPDVLSTVQLPVKWNPGAECPAFEQFLGEVLPADCLEPTEGGPGFIWELLGYCLYSGNPHHVAVLLYGNGRNGKGALLRVIERLVGASNTSSVPLHDLSENRFRAATLYGRLLNIAGDLDARWLANTATFKAITGGDSVQAERKYGAAFDFTPWALPIYSTNKAFGSADSSEGYLARWVVVPFPNSFLGREDRNLDARLGQDDELQGVLRRAAEALPALMKRGRLPEPQSVTEAKRRFVLSGDQVRAWLDEECVLEPDAWSPGTELFGSYLECNWEDRGAKVLSRREFYNRLAQVGGITEAKRRGTRGYRGIRVRGLNESVTV